MFEIVRKQRCMAYFPKEYELTVVKGVSFSERIPKLLFEVVFVVHWIQLSKSRQVLRLFPFATSFHLRVLTISCTVSVSFCTHNEADDGKL